MSVRTWHEETILSRMITLARGQEEIRELGAQGVPLASGQGFELGGGDLNQPLYDRPCVAGLCRHDLNSAVLEDARKRA